MADKTEHRGIEELVSRLIALGRDVQTSPRKTFDLVVDQVASEVKVKGDPLSRIDFVGLTDAQYRELKAGTRFKLFIVANTKQENPALFEVLEIEGSHLSSLPPKVESTYYFYGKQLRSLPSKIITAALPSGENRTTGAAQS